MRQHKLPIVVLFATLSVPALATERSPLDGTSWGVVYDVPETRAVTVRADVPYLEDARGRLTIDLYLPSGFKATDRRPAVVFVNAIGDRPNDKVKHWEIYRSWPRLLAAHGFVGVSMECDRERVEDSLDGVFRAPAGYPRVAGSRVSTWASVSETVSPTKARCPVSIS